MVIPVVDLAPNPAFRCIFFNYELKSILFILNPFSQGFSKKPPSCLYLQMQTNLLLIMPPFTQLNTPYILYRSSDY